MPSADDIADAHADADPAPDAKSADGGADTDSAAPRTQPKIGRRLQRMRVLTAAVVLGGACGLAAVLLYYGRREGPPLPRLTIDRFDEARAKWKANALPNYDIRIEVKGIQAAVYDVQVRDGAARRALRNGKPLTQRRTWGTWSVDGMFATIAADVEQLRKAQAGRDAELGALQVTLGAEFDAQYHYPARYYRLEQVQFGNNRSASWEVTRFRVIDVNDTQADPSGESAS